MTGEKDKVKGLNGMKGVQTNLKRQAKPLYSSALCCWHWTIPYCSPFTCSDWSDWLEIVLTISSLERLRKHPRLSSIIDKIACRTSIAISSTDRVERLLLRLAHLVRWSRYVLFRALSSEYLDWSRKTVVSSIHTCRQHTCLVTAQSSTSGVYLAWDNKTGGAANHV